MIKIQEVTKKYANREIISNLNLELPDRGIVALVGASGSGKTTLLNLLSGIDMDYQGNIIINGTNFKRMDEKEITNYRLRNIGYVFQNFNLLNLENGNQNIRAVLDSATNASPRIRKRRIKDFLKLMDVNKISDLSINKMSGGEKQRIAIIRAVINDPKIILCDEPTGALDEENSNQILDILRNISAKSLVIIATHDIDNIRRIADLIYSFDTSQLTINNPLTSNEYSVISVKKKIRKSNLPYTFKIGHSIRRMKTKKWRTLIANSMLSLALTGIGLSYLISSSLSSKIEEAFSSLIPGNQIVMSKKNETINTISNVYAASLEKVSFIKENYPSFISDFGATYQVNFEDFFKDENEVYINGKVKKIYMPYFSVRSFNDFRWLKDDSIVYPYSFKSLENDEVIIGINYEEMTELCFGLQIQRNFQSLGDYLKENSLQMVLDVANYTWEYADEQTFTIVGVIETNKSCLYHTNHLWNQHVIENEMRFPTNDGSDQYFPWEMLKHYFIETLDNPKKFLDFAIYDNDLFDFVFEKPTYMTMPTICSNVDVCDTNRLLVYYVDKDSINPNDLNIIKNYSSSIKNYYFTSDFGYASYGDNILSGFSKNFFLSNDISSLEEVIDADTTLGDELGAEISLPSNVVQGNYLNGLGGGLRFSTLMNDFVSGREAINNDEIVISSGLANKLKMISGYLYAGSVKNETIVDAKIVREYSINKLNIVGVIDEENDYIYHNNEWTISFFRDKVGVSSFSLIPKSVVFEFDSNFDTTNEIDKLSSLFKKYSFTSPVKEITKSIESTLKYANIILISFSCLALLISLLLFATIITLNINENIDEIKLFHYIGISKSDISSLFSVQSVLQGFIGFLISAIEIIVCDFAINKGIGNMFSTNLSFSLSYKPLLLILFIGIVMPFVISKIIISIMLYKKH